MGARIIVERLSDASDNKWVRVIVNGNVIPLKNCQDGVGYTCSLSKLRDLFMKRLGDDEYTRWCKVKHKRPQWLKFYWDWKNRIESN
ncbi:unnamed protein product [Ambrosiozyma monospora]|nr:unnamed protein product [Ambrosiozyma monospora]